MQLKLAACAGAGVNVVAAKTVARKANIVARASFIGKSPEYEKSYEEIVKPGGLNTL